jgi:phosphatidate cytidylyltransferase
MLTGIIYNQWSYFILFTLIHFGCWLEYQRMIGFVESDYKQISSFHRNNVMLLGWCFMLLNTNETYQINHISLHGIGWYGILVLTIIFCLNEIVLNKNLNLKVIAYSAFGLVYMSVSWGLLINLRNYSSFINSSANVPQWLLPLLLIVSIWINDSMAYMVGSFIGKTPLTIISPQKTWEGTVGGALLAILGVTSVCYYIFKIDYWQILLIISSVAAIAGTCGDLLQSKLKRLAGVKDSGQIFPGHGGFLDRFDSLLLATPFLWLVLRLLY